MRRLERVLESPHDMRWLGVVLGRVMRDSRPPGDLRQVLVRPV